MKGTRRYLLCLACIAAVLSAPATTVSAGLESCLVSVVRLSGQPRGGGAGSKVSVDIIIGKRRLFQTDWRAVGRADFGNRITFKTARSIPVRFLVRLWTPFERPPVVDQTPERKDPAPGRPVESMTPVTLPRQNDVLATAFEGLIGDYDFSETEQPARKDDQAIRRETSAAEARGGSAADARGNSRADAPGSGKGREVVLCETEIAWPPEDGVHKLDCGGATLEVSTGMVR